MYGFGSWNTGKTEHAGLAWIAATVLLCWPVSWMGGCTPAGGQRAGETRVDRGARVSVEVKWLGVTVQDVPERVAEYYSLDSTKGAVVTSVSSDSPAKEAGLQWGDLILALDDVEVVSPQDLAGWSGVLGRNRVSVGIARGGSAGKVEVVLSREAGSEDEAVPPTGPADAEEDVETIAPPTQAEEAREEAPQEEESAQAPAAPSREDAEPVPVEPDLEGRAYGLFSQGRLQEAVDAYQRLVAQEPENAQAYSNLGAVLNLLGQAEQALAAFDRAVSLDPGFAHAHFNRGLALWSLGRFEEALVAYRSASALAPNLLEARVAEADALLQLGRTDEALTANDRALEQGAPGASVLRQRGDIFRALGRLESAEAAYRDALAAAPDDPETLLTLGICLDEQGKDREALDVFDALVASGNGGATAYHNRALTRLRAGNAVGALADEDVAIEMEPGFLAARTTRAEALLALGRTEEAVLGWGAVIESHPHGATEALERLVRLARDLASRPEGVRQLQHWLIGVGEDPGEADGVVGPGTRQALSRFQEREGLRATGDVNGVTLYRLILRVTGTTGALD